MIASVARRCLRPPLERLILVDRLEDEGPADAAIVCEAVMLIASGIFFLLFGLFGCAGQLISAVDFRFAQRHGLQEGDGHTDPLYWALELNAARWDPFVLWTLPVAGVLMLLDHSWWPYLALIAGGVHVDAGGREMVKVLALRSHGVRVGTAKEQRTGLVFLSFLVVVGLWAALYGLIELA